MKKRLTLLVAAAVFIVATAAVFAGVEAENSESIPAVDIRLGTASMGGNEYLVVTYTNSHNATVSEEIKVYLRKEVIIQQLVVVPANTTAIYYYSANVGPKGRAVVSTVINGEEIFGIPLCYGLEKCAPSKKPAA